MPIRLRQRSLFGRGVHGNWMRNGSRILEGARGCERAIERRFAGRRVVVKNSDLVSVVAPIRHLEPRTCANGRRQLLNSIANGLGSVKKAAVPKSAAPLSCELLGRRRVVEIRHVARPIVCWRNDSRRRREGHVVCAAGVRGGHFALVGTFRRVVRAGDAVSCAEV